MAISALVGMRISSTELGLTSSDAYSFDPHPPPSTAAESIAVTIMDGRDDRSADITNSVSKAEGRGQKADSDEAISPLLVLPSAFRLLPFPHLPGLSTPCSTTFSLPVVRKIEYSCPCGSGPFTSVCRSSVTPVRSSMRRIERDCADAAATSWPAVLSTTRSAPLAGSRNTIGVGPSRTGLAGTGCCTTTGAVYVSCRATGMTGCVVGLSSAGRLSVPFPAAHPEPWVHAARRAIIPKSLYGICVAKKLLPPMGHRSTPMKANLDFKSVFIGAPSVAQSDSDLTQSTFGSVNPGWSWYLPDLSA